MSRIENTINIYQELKKYRYQVNIEDGTSFSFKFLSEHYHHLAGFQHLTDFPYICNPPTGRRKFFSIVKKGEIGDDLVMSSSKYYEMKERIENFDKLLTIMKPGDSRVIV